MTSQARTLTSRRNMSVTTEEYVETGEKLFRAMYRETADNVQGLLDEIYPDIGTRLVLRSCTVVILNEFQLSTTRLVLQGHRLRHDIRAD